MNEMSVSEGSVKRPLRKFELVDDVVMIVLVIINLHLIVFDWLFSVLAINSLLASVAPEFHQFYGSTIHADFFYYDLFFVAIFLSEFVIRWIIAVREKTYHRWFFYPFIHAYDLLGCIPIGAFRWLRLLRVVSLVYRLQRAGLIDLSKTAAWQFVQRYYQIVVEEISDRVVLNVLGGVQQQIQQGNPLVHRVQREVLQPRAKQLVDYIAERVITVIEASHERYRDDLGNYLVEFTEQALKNTRSGSKLAALPVVGPRVVMLVSETVRELGSALVEQLISDLTQAENRAKLDEVLITLFEDAAIETEQINQLVSDTLLDILEQIKAEVAKQQWKQQ